MLLRDIVLMVVLALCALFSVIFQFDPLGEKLGISYGIPLAAVGLTAILVITSSIQKRARMKLGEIAEQEMLAKLRKQREEKS